MIASFFFGGCSKAMFLMGVFQLCTSVALVGWVWSVYWGYLICKNKKDNEHMPVPLNDVSTNRDQTNIAQT